MSIAKESSYIIFQAQRIFKWIQNGFTGQKKIEPGKYDEFIKGYKSLKSLDDIYID